MQTSLDGTHGDTHEPGCRPSERDKGYGFTSAGAQDVGMFWVVILSAERLDAKGPPSWGHLVNVIWSSIKKMCSCMPCQMKSSPLLLPLESRWKASIRSKAHAHVQPSKSLVSISSADGHLGLEHSASHGVDDNC
jgi:hypothetical protein